MLEDLENIHLQRVKEYSFADKLSKAEIYRTVLG
jgi:hypothetical protein